MSIPLFFFNGDITGPVINLDEETSRHLVQVLRKKNGDTLQLTNGKGILLDAVITEAHKKITVVAISNQQAMAPAKVHITIAISPVKNANRFEWFIEKATEIGITDIIPLICSRTEKEKLRIPRLQQIMISAMLQSQQTWLPVLHYPMAFEKVTATIKADQAFIAHCLEAQRTDLVHEVNNEALSRMILIGPEGDFTRAEIEQALTSNFKPVTLGKNRLRTETAGVVAATILKFG
jgi:16S rRNA (uracil1498-N3)-methyltransferase